MPSARAEGVRSWDGQADIIVAPVDGKMIDIVKLYLQYIIRSEGTFNGDIQWGHSTGYNVLENPLHYAVHYACVKA